MKLALSNIALPSFDHSSFFPELADMGFSGLEVAPSRVWADTSSISRREVEIYRQQAEGAGLSILGLHSLFFDHPELMLFSDGATTQALMDFMVRLSRLCADLGGRSLVFGSGRMRDRGPLSEKAADAWLIEFLQSYAEKVESHRTCLVIEPLSISVTDYINSISHAQRIVRAVDHPAVGLHIDLAAAAWAKEIREDIFHAATGDLVHVHVSEVELAPIYEKDTVDHAEAARLLREIGYTGYCSLEQPMVSGEHMEAIRKSCVLLKEHYA